MISYKRRVRRGVALLDRVLPGWHRKINLETLSLASCENCVCGQVARKTRSRLIPPAGSCGDNSFNRGIDYLSHKVGYYVESLQYGFAALTYDGYTKLDAEWGKIIRERLEAEARS